MNLITKPRISFRIFQLLIVFALLFLFVKEITAQRTVTAGSSQIFNNAATYDIRSTRLSDTKILVVYSKATGGTNNKYARVGTVNSASHTISWGTEKLIGGPYTSSAIDVAGISSSKAVVVLEDQATAPDEMKYVVLDIDGTDITLGPATTFSPHYISYGYSYRMTALSKDLVVVCYEDDDSTDKLYVIAGSINGTSISWGTPVAFFESSVAYASICRLSNTKFAIAFEDDAGVTDYGKIRIGEVSGTTITAGASTTTFSASHTGAVALTALSENNLAIGWEEDGNDDNPVIQYAAVSGTTVTMLGTKTTLSTSDVSGDFHLAMLSDTEVVASVNLGSSAYGKYFLCTLAADTFSSSPANIISGEPDEAQVEALTSDLFVVNYMDDSNVNGSVADRGESKVYTLTSASNPEINVQGNSTDIELGDDSPSTNDHTDFGTGLNLSRIFTIQNTGSGTLTLGSNAVTLSGDNADDFTVSTQPSITVSGSSSTSFTIDFNSIVASTRSAVVNISSDDLHEPNYFFSIQAVGDDTGAWDGSSGTDWSVAANWGGNAVPGASTDVTIPAGLSNYPTISASTSASCNNLTVESGGNLIIESDASNTGSLIVSGTSSGNIIAKRYMTGSATGWHLTGVPVGGQDIKNLIDNANNSFSTHDTKYGLGVYNEATDTWTTYTTDTYGTAGNLVAGQGYETNIQNDGTVSYEGTVNVSQVDIAITRSGNGWNLLGNPYPCALYANDPSHSTNNFIDINAAVIDDSYEAIYFWNASTAQYDIINNASPATYIPHGQAFFVKSVSGGETASFTTAMRTHQTGATFKTTVNDPQIIIKADNGEESKSTEFRFIKSTSTGLDPGYDAGMFNGNTSGFQLYSRLMQDNGVAFALQCLPIENYDGNEIPLEFYATTNEIQFSAVVSDLPDNIRLYLEDRLNNSFNQLGRENIYQTTVDIGLVKDRFYLHTSSQALGQIEVPAEAPFNIVLNPQNSSIRIEGKLENLDKIEIIDVSGRMVYQAELNNSNEIKLPIIINGVYVVKLTGDKVNYSKKINWIN